MALGVGLEPTRAYAHRFSKPAPYQARLSQQTTSNIEKKTTYLKFFEDTNPFNKNIKIKRIYQKG